MSLPELRAPFLQLRDAHKHFGPNHVLRGIDLAVDEHDVACLIGASRSGKSTLLRCTNGSETIDGVEIRGDGERGSGRGVDLNALRADVGISFHSFNLVPHMSIVDNGAPAPRRVLKLTRRDAVE